MGTALDHAAWKAAFSPTDQALFLRYLDRLEQVHHVLTEHPETPSWWSWVLGYARPQQVLEERAMAYRGARAAGFLPEAAGQSPEDRSVVTDSHQGHPGFDRLLQTGLLHLSVLALALPFIGFAWRSLRAGPPRKSPGVCSLWLPGPMMAAVFWSLLLATLMAGLFTSLTERLPPPLKTEPWSATFETLSYLILQGLPVLFCAALFLPNRRHFTRVLGLSPGLLLRPATLALGLGLFGIDALANLALYEIEKMSGQIDTRDFLPATLIDAGGPQLLSQLVTSAAIAPLGEEILFRGFLFNGLRARLGTWGAAILSGLIFGGLHYYSWFGMASITLYGIFACWIFARTGSLWPAILLHALSNFLITLSCWYAYSDSPFAR
jgi:membrane protease YdiL (CAAX protease family)